MKSGDLLLNMHKKFRNYITFAICLFVFSFSLGSNVFAYNSDYLDDASWVDSESAVTKIVSYNSDNGLMDCAVSYLVDEDNSTAYFQILTNNFNITKDSDVRVCFDVLADNQLYSFYVDKSGLQSSNDYSKLFAAKGNFTSSKNVGSGTYIVAMDVKTKASINKINIALSVDSMKYDLIDGILLNEITTTKKTTTTKIKTTASARTTQRLDNNVGEVTVVIADSTTKKKSKSKSEKVASTKFVGQNKYHTTAKSDNETKFSPTGTTVQTTALQEQDTTEAVWHTYDKDMSYSTKIKITTAVGIALGVVGLLLTGFAIGKASNKKEQKKDETDKSPDDEKIIDDDFEF